MKFTLPSGRHVEIQELTSKAERILTSKPDLKSGKWFNKFIAYALVSLDDKPVPENEGELISLLLDMKSGDRNYLALQIRMLNYGPELIFNHKCPECGTTSGYKINLQEMLDDGTLQVHPYRKDVPITVETRAGIAEIDYMTGRTEQWLAEQKELDLTKIAMASCKSFNGKPPEYKDFTEMFVRDLSQIRLASNELNAKGGLTASIELDCPECSSSYSVMLYQIPDFFTPLTTAESIGR